MIYNSMRRKRTQVNKDENFSDRNGKCTIRWLNEYKMKKIHDQLNGFPLFM